MIKQRRQVVDTPLALVGNERSTMIKRHTGYRCRRNSSASMENGGAARCPVEHSNDGECKTNKVELPQNIVVPCNSSTQRASTPSIDPSITAPTCWGTNYFKLDLNHFAAVNGIGDTAEKEKHEQNKGKKRLPYCGGRRRRNYYSSWNLGASIQVRSCNQVCPEKRQTAASTAEYSVKIIIASLQSAACMLQAQQYVQQ